MRYALPSACHGTPTLWRILGQVATSSVNRDIIKIKPNELYVKHKKDYGLIENARSRFFDNTDHKAIRLDRQSHQHLVYDAEGMLPISDPGLSVVLVESAIRKLVGTKSLTRPLKPFSNADRRKANDFNGWGTRIRT
jgi:hypothetical protein